MPAPADSTRKSWLPSDISLYVALHVTIAAFSLATLAGAKQQLGGLSVLLVLSLAVGGVVAPRFAMPPFTQAPGVILPRAWALNPIKKSR